MKIVYCLPSLHNSGGIERVLSLKANYLADIKGWDIHIVTTGQKGLTSFFAFSPRILFYDLNINYDELNSFKSKILYQRSKKKKHRDALSKLLNELKADIVVSMFTNEVSFLPELKDGSKKVVELHFSKYFRNLHDRFNHANLLQKMISRILNYRDFSKLGLYDKFVVLTEEDKRNWKGMKNIEVIYNPMSFSSDNLASLDSKNVLAIGRLVPQKGFDMLIEIWKQIETEREKDWQLNIYGNGPDYKYLSEKIKAYHLEDSIHILEPVKDVRPVYANSSIFCFPSRYEGFGMAIVEAMACGLPVISFKSPCGPSELIKEGVSGELVENYDIHAFAQKLLFLMQNEKIRKDYGKAASEETKERFNIETIMEQWVALFQTVTNK